MFETSTSISFPFLEFVRKIIVVSSSIILIASFMPFWLANWEAWVLTQKGYTFGSVFRAILIFLVFDWINNHCVTLLQMIKFSFVIKDKVIVLPFLIHNTIVVLYLSNHVHLFQLAILMLTMFSHLFMLMFGDHITPYVVMALDFFLRL